MLVMGSLIHPELAQMVWECNTASPRASASNRPVSRILGVRPECVVHFQERSIQPVRRECGLPAEGVSGDSLVRDGAGGGSAVHLAGGGTGLM